MTETAQIFNVKSNENNKIELSYNGVIFLLLPSKNQLDDLLTAIDDFYDELETETKHGGN